jgi:fructan beta-fructosidase
MEMDMALTIRNIDITHPYLLLPVRYDAHLGLMRFTLNGKQERKFGLKLADSTPDYFVFATVEHLIGQSLQITYESEEAADLSVLRLSDFAVDGSELYHERYRPQYHFSSRRGFINDPNGLIYFKDEYHLFYQHQPFGTDIGFDLKFWGHAISTDLIHWRELSPVLYPDEHGAMYSGSAVVDWHNSSGFQTGDEPPLVALYTADGRNADVERPFTQCLAYSNDRGRTWTKYEGNPVLGHIVASNRDPRVIWHEPTKRWIMALFLDKGIFGLFGSENLRNWSKLSEIELAGSQDCPDLFQLPVDGDTQNTRWVFWAGNTGYRIGWFNGTTFLPEGVISRMQPEGTSYAAQTWSNISTDSGNRFQIAWFLTPTPGMPFTHCMTIPCELSLKTIGNRIRLCADPIRELTNLRMDHHGLRDIVLDPDRYPEFNPRDREAPARWGAWVRYPIGSISDTIDIECAFDLGSADSVSISIRGVSVVYDVTARRISIEGGMARMTPSVGTTLEQRDGIIQLRILADRTTLEVFADFGATLLSLGVIPMDDNNLMVVSAKGGKARFGAIDYWRLNSIWQTNDG